MRKVTKISLSAVTGLIALGAIGAASGSHNAAHTAPAPKITHSAPAVPAPAAPAQTPAPQTPAEAVSGWWTATGQAQANTVQADLSQIGTDANAQNIPALAADGTKLHEDAQAAISGYENAGISTEVPQFTTDYLTAMGNYSGAGSILAGLSGTGSTDGQVSMVNEATTLMQQGTSGVQAATSDIKALSNS